MGTVMLSAQSLVTVEEALAFLQDQGSPSDDQDLLKTHLNAIASMMIKLTGRDRLVWVAGDDITEYRDGGGRSKLYLRNAPIRSLTSVTLNPQQASPTTVVVPTGSDTYSDGCYFDSRTGALVLKSLTFPDGPSSAKIVYRAGYYKQDVPNPGDLADVEAMELKLIAMNALARKWARWKNGRHGISSESKGDVSVHFTADDITKSEVQELRRYRRTMFS